MRSASATWARVTAVCIAGSLQPPLPLVTAFEEVPNPNIELLSFVQILAGKILRTEKWNELRIHPKSRIGAQIRGDLLRLILKDQSSGGFERMVMRQRQINGLIKSDERRILPASLSPPAAKTSPPGRTSESNLERIRVEFKTHWL